MLRATLPTAVHHVHVHVEFPLPARVLCSCPCADVAAHVNYSVGVQKPQRRQAQPQPQSRQILNEYAGLLPRLCPSPLRTYSGCRFAKLPAWLGFPFSVRKPRHAAPVVSNHFGWLCFHWCRNSLQSTPTALREICEQLVCQTAKYYHTPRQHTHTHAYTHISGSVKCLSLKWTKSMCRMWNHFKSARLLLPLTKCARFFLSLPLAFSLSLSVSPSF